MTGLVQCLLNTEAIDPHLGKLDRNASYFCTAQSQRLPQGLFCCAPQATDALRLLLTTPSSGEREIKFYDVNGANILKNEKKVVYLAHGWIEKIDTSPWINRTRDGFVKRGYAVVVVDWGHLNQLSYWQSIANVRTVGAAVGHSIVKWGVSYMSWRH